MLADELVACEALKGLEPAAKVISGDEVGEVLTTLIVAAIASLISDTAEPPAPGVVNWMPLLVSTVWIL